MLRTTVVESPQTLKMGRTFCCEIGQWQSTYNLFLYLEDLVSISWNSTWSSVALEIHTESRGKRSSGYPDKSLARSTHYIWVVQTQCQVLGVRILWSRKYSQRLFGRAENWTPSAIIWSVVCSDVVNVKVVVTDSKIKET